MRISISDIARYTIMEEPKGKFKIVKVINEYETRELAEKNLIGLACGSVQEENLLIDYRRKLGR